MCRVTKLSLLKKPYESLVNGIFEFLNRNDQMAIEISGRVVNVLAPVTGQSKSGNGEWKKQEFVIETQSQYPKKVLFSLWGDKTEQINGLQAGDDVKVSFDPESREYNGRWYTDLRAWRVERGAAALAGNNQSARQDQGMNQDRDYNFNQERSAPQSGGFQQQGGGSSMNDDLPF